MISYDIPIEDYHRSERVSTSKLKDLASGGPRYYAMRHIQRKIESYSSDAKDFGTGFEDLLCRPQVFREKFVIKPEEMKFTNKDGKAWRDEQTAAGFTILTADEFRTMDAMVTSIRENATAMEMIERACQQPTITCEWPGLPGVQSRPDWLALDGVALSGFQPYTLDLKSTRHLSRLAGGRDVAAFGYHAQAGLGSYALARNGVTQCPAFLLAVEKCGSFRAQVIEMPREWLSIGWAWCEAQLVRLARHYESGDWPRADAEVVTLPPPPPWVASAANDSSEDEAA